VAKDSGPGLVRPLSGRSLPCQLLALVLGLALARMGFALPFTFDFVLFSMHVASFGVGAFHQMVQTLVVQSRKIGLASTICDLDTSQDALHHLALRECFELTSTFLGRVDAPPDRVTAQLDRATAFGNHDASLGFRHPAANSALVSHGTLVLEGCRPVRPACEYPAALAVPEAAESPRRDGHPGGLGNDDFPLGDPPLANTLVVMANGVRHATMSKFVAVNSRCLSVDHLLILADLGENFFAGCFGEVLAVRFGRALFLHVLDGF